MRVLLDDEPLPVIRDVPGSYWHALPMDLEVGSTHRLEVETPSPFGPGEVVTVEPRAFVVDRTADAVVIAAHEDLRGPVTYEDPARPGEVIHLWAVNLGVVTPPFPGGQQTPASPLYRLVDPPHCRLGIEDLPILFAGLAPGMTAVYQVSLRLPSVAPEFGRGLFHCAYADPASVYRTGGWLPVTGR